MNPTMAEAKTIGEVVSIESELTRREADLDSLIQRKDKLSGLLARIDEMGGAVAAIDYMKETLIAANAARSGSRPRGRPG